MELCCIITQNNFKKNSDFWCLNCLHSFRIKNKLKSQEKGCKNKGFCTIVIPSEKDTILEFNQYVKSDKMSYIIYADIESLIKKINACPSNPENSSTLKIGEHIRYGYSMSAIFAFHNTRNKHTLYLREDCMKKFGISFRELTNNIIDFEKKINVTVDKKRRYKSMLYLWKKIPKKVCE